MRYRPVFTADEAACVRAAIAREMSIRGIGQRKAAVLFGIAQQSISHVLSGKSEPKRRTVEKVAAALGITVNALISGTAYTAECHADGRATERAIGEAFSAQVHIISDAVAALRFLLDAGISSPTPNGARLTLDAAARARESAGSLTPSTLAVEIVRAAVTG